MGIWKARLMALLSMVAMLLALAAPVALADDECELQRRGDNPDQVVCDGERLGVGQFVNQADLEGDDNDGDEFFLSGLDDDFDSLGLGFGFEFEDIDCDEIEDDDDPVFDEGLCLVEGEFLGEDVEFLVDF